MRSGLSPNQRVQDGLKFHWLCEECEGRLNRAETQFATHLFHPYSSGGSGNKFPYGPWLLYFCVSLSWRVLHFYRDSMELENLNADVLERIATAEETWREYLLGKRPHPGAFRQHLIPADGVSATSVSLEPNINRYLLRAIDMDLVRGDTTDFIYTKIGRFIFVGFIREDIRGHWHGGRIQGNGGSVEPKNYKMPLNFLDFINHKARRAADILNQVSPRQKEIIGRSFRAGASRFVGSDQHQALLHDINMFGSKAVRKEGE